MADAEGEFDALREMVDDAAVAPPEYLTLPIASRTVMVTPDDLAPKGHLRCSSKGRVVGSISNGMAAIPVQREFRCDRSPDHSGPHLLLIGSAGAPELSWFYEWGERGPVVEGG